LKHAKKNAMEEKIDSKHLKNSTNKNLKKKLACKTSKENK
jgi:hypothetical protein